MTVFVQLRRQAVALAFQAVWGVAATGALVAGAAHAAPPPAAPRANWSEVFAGDTASCVFLGAGGELFRAPFDLASRSPLWAPIGERQLARFRVSPDGERVAWLERGGDQDTTRLWIARTAGPAPTAPRARFAALMPGGEGPLIHEPGMPTVHDESVRGGRLLSPSPLAWRHSVNPLEWTPNGDAIVFGYEDGVALATADSGVARQVTAALAVRLRRLEATGIVLASALTTRAANVSGGMPGGVRPDGSTQLGTAPAMVTNLRSELLYPYAGRWKVFAAPGFEFGHPWAASDDEVWWADTRIVRSARNWDPNPKVELESDEPVIWLGFAWQPERALLCAAGRTFWVRAMSDSVPRVRFRTGTPIRAAAQMPGGTSIVVVTADSLFAWQPDLASAREAMALRGAAGDRVLWTRDGICLARDGGFGKSALLARVDREHQRVEPIALPRSKAGRFTVSPAGRLIYAEAAAKPPAFVNVYDAAADRWIEVANPGITAWEPLTR